MRNATLALLVGLLLAFSGSAEAGFLDDLEAYWSFDMDFTDSSVNGRDGTVSSGASIVADAILGGGALSLTGSGSSVGIVGYQGVLGSQPRTMAAWIKTTDVQGAILGWGPNSGGRKWVFRTQNNNGTNDTIRVEVNGGYIVGDTVVTDDAWHHVAAVLPAGATDVNQMELYVDGQLETISASQSRTINTGAHNHVLVGNDVQNRALAGLMDEVGTWSRALDAGEISALYNGGAGLDIFAKPELIWDGQGPGNWGHSRWIGSPPDFPDETTNATIDTPNIVTVAAARSVYDLTISNAGAVAIGAGNSLSVGRNLSAADGSVSLGAGASLAVAGSGSLGSLAVAGAASVETGGTLAVSGSGFDGLHSADPFVKTGSGTLRLDNSTGTGVVNVENTIFEVQEGTLHSAGLHPLGVPAGIVLSGGTLSVEGTPGTVDNQLNYAFYDNAASNNLQNIDDGADNDQNGGLFSLTPSDQASWPGAVQGKDVWTGEVWQGGNMSDTYCQMWWGHVNVPVGGDGVYTLDVHGDDYEIFWLDVGQDGDFDTGTDDISRNIEGEEGWNTPHTETVTLTGGQSYDFAVAHREGTGGDFFNLTVTLPDDATTFRINPSDPAQDGLWSRTALGPIDMTDTPITVEADSGLSATTGVPPAAFGPLSLEPGATLTTTGADMTFASIAASGAVTLATENAVATGLYSDGGTTTTFTKDGSGTLTLDNSGGGASAGATTFEVAQGTLRAIGADPLGGAPHVVLGGGTLEVSLGAGGPVPTAGMQAHWRFDETAGAVAVNSANPGTNNGALLSFPGDDSQWVAGKVGGALHFDGVDDWVDAGSTNLTGSYTVALWAKADSLTQHSEWDSAFSSADGSGGFQIDVGAATNGIYRFRGASNVNIGPVDTDWVHLGVTYDGTTLRTYYNGVLANTSGTSGQNFVDYFMGRNRNGDQRFAGTLDEIFAYDRALTATEMATLVSGGVSGDIVMTDTDFTVTADSTLNALTGGSSAFGTLTMEAGTLTTAGSPGGISFTDTTVAPGATAVGFDTVVDTRTGPLDGGSNTMTFTKTGAANLTFDGPATNLQGASLDVQAGRVVLTSDTTVAAARLSGGTVDTGPGALTISEGGELAYGATTVAATVGSFRATGSDLAASRLLTLIGGKTFITSAAGAPPLSYWSFENDLDPGHDDADGNDGAVGGLPWSDTGMIGKALGFDGDDDYVTFGDVGQMDSPSAFSVAMWFRRDGDPGSATNHNVNNVLIAQSSNGDNDNLEIGTEGGVVELYVDTGGTDSLTHNAGIQDFVWHHLALAYDRYAADGNELSLYVDGGLAQAWNSPSGNLAGSAGSPLSLGIARPGDGPANGDWGDFQGLMDEVFLYTRAITAAEVQALYQAGLAGEYLTNLDLRDTDLRVEDASILGLDANGTVDVGELSLQLLDGAIPLTLETDASHIGFESLNILDPTSIRIPGQVYDLLALTDAQGFPRTGIFDDQMFGEVLFNGQPITLLDGEILYSNDGTLVQFGAYIPEPATVVLLGLGAVGLLRRRRRNGRPKR